MTSALIVEVKRIFGINGYPKSKTWYMHPLGKVKEHVKIEPMRLEDIMEEYAIFADFSVNRKRALIQFK